MIVGINFAVHLVIAVLINVVRRTQENHLPGAAAGLTIMAFTILHVIACAVIGTVLYKWKKELARDFYLSAAAIGVIGFSTCSISLLIE